MEEKEGSTSMNMGDCSLVLDKDAHVLTIYHLKGGVGKSTLAVLLARFLSSISIKCLLIDCDVQNSSSFSLLPDGEDSDDPHNLYNAIVSKNIRSEIIPIANNLDLVQSSFELVQLYGMQDKTQLSRAISPVKNEYDYIIFDTSPALDSVTLSAIAAADMVIMPVEFGSKFSAKTTAFIQKYLTENVFPDRKLRLSILYNFRNPKKADRDSKTPYYEKMYKDLLPENFLFWDTPLPRTSQVARVIDNQEAIRNTSSFDLLYPAMVSIAAELQSYDWNNIDDVAQLTESVAAPEEY